MRFPPGTRLGPYELLDMLGAGGMGEVYRARDARLNRDVAVKVLLSEVSNDPSRLRRFEQEARAAGALNHPNVLAVYDIGSHEGVPYVVSELLEGETLRDRLQAGDFPLRKAVDFAVQTVHGLAAAHEKGIVHRDLKPENLFITKDSRVKILDFGLAKLREHESVGPEAVTATGKNEVLGTVGYMAPQQIKGQEVDHRADIFAFGAVFYEMLSKRKAFQKETGAESLAAILTEDPPDLSASDPRISSALSRIVHRCLEKRPEERFQSARDLGFALEGLSGSSDAVPGSKGIILRGAPSGSRRRAGSLAVIAVAILAGLGWVAWRLRHSDSSWQNPLIGARFTRLTDFEGSEVDATISSDGKFVAFLADRDGPFDAFVGQVGGTGFINLTKGQFPQLFSEGVRNVGFSHDGANVWVHVTTGGPTPDHSTWLIPTLGGAARPFLPTGISPTWSPDGARLLYHEADKGDPIFIADRNGASPKQLFADKPGVHWHFPAWSVDGRFVFFFRGASREKGDIWRFPSVGGNPERMTFHEARVAYPTLLDERTLVYCAPNADGTGSAIYAMDLQTRIAHPVTAGLEEFISVAASADGFRLAASVANPTKSLSTVPITDRIVTESDVSRLPIPSVRAAYPRWGPGFLLFLSSRGGADGLWKFREGEVAELWNPSGGAVVGAPAVSPNGQQIAFVARKDGRARLILMAADGTNVRPVAESLDLRDSPSWSPDSRWIAVSAGDTNENGIFKVPLDEKLPSGARRAGPPVRLVEGTFWSPVWSPDGRFIIYAKADKGANRFVRAVTAEGAPFPLPELSVLWTGDRYRFLPDGKSIVILKGGFRRQDFWLFDLTSGKLRQLTNLRPGYEQKSFDVSLDGKQIVFDRVKENSDIVLIDRVRR
jgi:serine/threonine protein kinase/Tol biopolymer transport system component